MALLLCACGSGARNATDGSVQMDGPAADQSDPDASPLPADARQPIRILPSSALVLGNGESACTHQVPPSGDGDRWCVFAVAELGARVGELWVIDVTRAATGSVPPCDGSSAECLRLTSTFPMSSAAFFNGDTLTYGSGDLPKLGEDYIGPIFAWRPGWSRGRQISSDRGITCGGQRRSSAASCLDDPDGDPQKRDSAAVRVGYLVDEAGGPLPSIGRFPLRSDSSSAWQSGFSPDGATYVLSTTDLPGEKQTLRTMATSAAELGSLSTRLEDVDYWALSNDGQRIYFIRVLDQRGDLFEASFPSGENVTKLEEGIRSYGLIGERPEDRAIRYIKNLGPGQGSYRLIAEPRAAAKTIFDFSDVLEGARTSQDLRYTAWLDFEFRGTVVHNADLSTCLLNQPGEPTVREPAFLDHASLMFWHQYSTEDSTRSDAYYADPADCRAKRLLARSVEYLVPVGDEGVLFGDESERATQTTTLKYWAATPDGSGLDPAGPVLLQRGVTRSPVFVGEAPYLLLFHVESTDTNAAGTYVFGPVPL